MVPRSSGPRSCLLGEEVGAGESTAGVRDRHGHGDRVERAGGLRSKRALHHAEELWESTGDQGPREAPAPEPPQPPTVA